MSEIQKQERLVQFKIRPDLLKQIDDYWPTTGKFSSRSQFIKYLLLEEINTKRLQSKPDEPSDLDEILKALEISANERIKSEEKFKSQLIERLDKLDKRINKVEKELGDSLDEHVSQD